VDRTRTDVGAAPGLAGLHVLVLWEGGFVRRQLEDGVTIVVGRNDDCEIQIVHPSLSRRHVAIHGGNPPRIEDLGSHNGVKVAERRIEPGTRVPLAPGQAVEAGPLLIVLQGGSPASGPAAVPSAMAEVRRLLALAAKSAISILLLGETGVGKEVAAEAIHDGSPRAKMKLVRLNCAAFTESLLDSELFGHEKGSFTGAVRAKPGLLESADGGTVFFDEVAELPLATQVKLLRVLENREVRRIGGMEARKIDVRFVSATNRDVRSLVSSGAFREDLYYRLNGMTVTVPPLRERRQEIPELVSTFVARECDRAGRPTLTVEPDAMSVLSAHRWPGNIRELRNVVDRAVMLAPGSVISREHVVMDPAPQTPSSLGGHPQTPGSQSSPGHAVDLRADVDAYERARVVEALERAGGNQTKAAQLLGLTRRVLISRLEAHNLPRPRKR
jgi:two-component system response regulator AtoC